MLDKRTEKAFLGKVRHNLKNPVNAILGYSEMLIEDCEDHSKSDPISDLEKINSAGHEIVLHIDEIFNDDRLEKGAPGQIRKFGEEIEVAIRIPLNSILGYTEMLMEDEHTEIKNFVDDLNKIHTSCQNLTTEIKSVIGTNLRNIEGQSEHAEEIGNLSIIQEVMGSIKPIKGGEQKETSTGTVLVVDDNENNTDLLQKRLEKEGHSVLICNNGRDTLNQIKDKHDKIDLILLDIIMPGINGYEVLKYVKSDERYYHIPVIMLSSMDEVDSIYRCFELGADDYVTKPFDTTILNARIDSNIEKKKLKDKEKVYLQTISDEKEKSERLLLNILPVEIAERLKSGETTIADKLDDVTILFADVVNFTKLSKSLSASDLVNMLNKVFRTFDDLCEIHGLEKIKPIGDSYMAGSGLPIHNPNHAFHALNMAMEMIQFTNQFNTGNNKLQIRIGLHSGPIVAGVIGKKKFVYDLWGDTVNIASRMESSGIPGKIHVSHTVMHQLKTDFDFIPCKTKEYKGIGEMKTYFLNV